MGTEKGNAFSVPFQFYSPAIGRGFDEPVVWRKDLLHDVLCTRITLHSKRDLRLLPHSEP